MFKHFALLLTAAFLVAENPFAQSNMSPEEIRIRGSYQLAMGRDPEARELGEWLKNVKSAPYNSMDVSQLARQHKNWINAYYKTSPDVKKLKEEIIKRAVYTAMGRPPLPEEMQKYMNADMSYTEIVADRVDYLKNSYGPWAHVIKRAFKDVNKTDISEERVNLLREKTPITFLQMKDLFAKERKIQKPRSLLNIDWLNLFIPANFVAEFNKFVGISNVISTGGGNVISTGGGNVIATGGGNIFDSKGYVIATGGGNVIATGGGNVISTGGGNVISTGGGN